MSVISGASEGDRGARGMERVAARPYARVALDIPIAPWFDYRVPDELIGTLGPRDWVLVPWGRGRRVGLVLSVGAAPELPEEKIRAIERRFATAPRPDAAWLALVEFAARYYHRHPGEVALPALPRLLRTPPVARARGCPFERARARFRAANAGRAPGAAEPAELLSGAALPIPAEMELNADQQRALDALLATEGFAVHLLHGITGSGKTEVYLRWIARILARDEHAQALMLVPEIALTPQLARQVAQRFPGAGVAVLHSGLGEAERSAGWVAAADGCARLVIGTRLAVLVPMPRLAAIVVDEEHDPSFRQQEGVHYSARDLAVAAASIRGIPVVLGSATPALESWHSAQRGRYRALSLPLRATGAVLPTLRIVSSRGETGPAGLTEVAREAIERVLQRGEQALVFINRRGFAPVLSCPSCGWLSQCGECSAYRVLHYAGAHRPGAGAAGTGRGGSRYRLQCHHCGGASPVPRACPECGDVDLQPLGAGTQRIEQELATVFPGARIARLDRDVASRRGAAERVLASVHAGEVDIVVGTQMLAKGHDFQRLVVVIVVDADAGLYAPDFRAPERLFATLMQVSGRAGRAAPEAGTDPDGGATPARGEVIVQTRFPEHPLFAALQAHDFTGFADALLAERREAGLPPFRHLALLRAEAASIEEALDFLAAAKAQSGAASRGSEQIRVFDPVPMPLARVKGRARAQLLVESPSRGALHPFVDAWLARLGGIVTRVRWQLEIDPIEI